MEALMRTGSGGFHFSSSTPAPPLLSRTRSAGAAGFSARPSAVHLEMKDQHHHLPLTNTLRRTSSCDSNAASLSHSTIGSPSALSLALSSGRSPASSCSAKQSALVADDLDLDFSGGGAGRGIRVGGGGRRPGGGGDHNSSGKGMGGYYKEMLQTDPSNPLLLMNYGKYLHDVQGDLQGAEDCFGRAVLASPDDGEALSLYGNLVWEAHRDGQRAHDYLQRAVQAAPDDCYVLASYANFLWDADDDEEDDEDHQASSSSSSSRPTGTTPAMVKAY